MCYSSWILVELQNKINQIEESDENYQLNKKWKKYRKQQDIIYEQIRRDNEMGCN